MNLCPPARLGVAKRKGGGPGGGSPGCTSRRFFRARKTGDTRPGGEASPLRCAWGDAPSVLDLVFAKWDRYPMGRDSVFCRNAAGRLGERLRIEPGPRLAGFAQEGKMCLKLLVVSSAR